MWKRICLELIISIFVRNLLVNSNFCCLSTLNDLEKCSKSASIEWRLDDCPLDGYLENKLARIRKLYKKAIKNAKKNYKRVKAGVD